MQCSERNIRPTAKTVRSEIFAQTSPPTALPHTSSYAKAAHSGNHKKRKNLPYDGKFFETFKISDRNNLLRDRALPFPDSARYRNPRTKDYA